MTSSPLFTILVPINRPPNLLPFCIASVQAQTVQSFELFIVCDGAPRSTIEKANELAAADSRIKVCDFGKGERYGEAHRDIVLRAARGTHVAQIADDDFWFPQYLAELCSLLSDVEFGNLIQANLSPEGEVLVYAGNLADAAVRARMLKKAWNFFGPSFAGYRLEAYRSLPEGWSPAPQNIPTDLHMWRKFLRHDGLRVGTRFSIQGAKFSAFQRAEKTIEERQLEHGRLVAQLSTPEGRREFRAKAFAELYDAQSIGYRRKIVTLRRQVDEKAGAPARKRQKPGKPASG